MARGFFKGLVPDNQGRGKPVATPVGQHVPSPKPVATPVPITTGRKISDSTENQKWYQGKGTFGTSEGAEQILQPGSEYESAFLAGTVNNVTSSVIASGQYDRAKAELTLTFQPHTGLRATIYQGISEAEAVGFFIAASKGAWWHQACLGPGWRPGNGTMKTWRFA